MDYLASVGGIAGLVSIVIHILEKVIAYKCHKRLHSSCCDKQIDMEVALDNGTPPTPVKKVVEP